VRIAAERRACCLDQVRPGPRLEQGAGEEVGEVENLDVVIDQGLDELVVLATGQVRPDHVVEQEV
jgi:hypothetical protein